jgi:hypothetical protein
MREKMRDPMRGLFLAALMCVPTFGSAASCIKSCCCVPAAAHHACCPRAAAKTCCGHRAVTPLPVAAKTRPMAAKNSANAAAWRLIASPRTVVAHRASSRAPQPSLSLLCILRC